MSSDLTLCVLDILLVNVDLPDSLMPDDIITFLLSKKLIPWIGK